VREKVLSGNIKAMFNNPMMFAPLLWMLFNATMLLAAILGTAALWRRGHRVEVLLLVLVIAGFVFATQTNGLERFRWPVAPVQAVLAGAAILLLNRKQLASDAEMDR